MFDAGRIGWLLRWVYNSVEGILAASGEDRQQLYLHQRLCPPFLARVLGASQPINWRFSTGAFFFGGGGGGGVCVAVATVMSKSANSALNE